MKCPCCSDKLFADCCEPVIKQEMAQTAEELMRSRYTAFCLTEIDYLLKTSHPKIRANESFESLEQWSKKNTWERLFILSTEAGNKNDTAGEVEFNAFYIDKNQVSKVHHEKSQFVKQGGKWLYYAGEIDPQPKVNKLGRNNPCPCGSGKKYKNCCF